jgi:hypothetical protein
MNPMRICACEVWFQLTLFLLCVQEMSTLLKAVHHLQVCVCVCVCERERERERDRVPCVRALELDVGCACGKIDVPKIMYTLNTVCLQVQSLGIARGRL